MQQNMVIAALLLVQVAFSAPMSDFKPAILFEVSIFNYGKFGKYEITIKIWKAFFTDQKLYWKGGNLLCDF